MSACVLLLLIVAPVLSAQDADLAQDAFAASGAFVADTAAHRDVMDVAFSMARDVVPGLGNTAGDSILVTITPMGARIAEARLHWVLEKNPHFEDAIRQAPSRPEDLAVDSSNPARWTGQALGAPPFLVNNEPFMNLWAFDLPDADFLYPGDVLRYCIVAQDDNGVMATLPADTTGLGTGLGYDPAFVVRALPSLVDDAGQQPSTLAILSTGDRSARALVETTLAQAGYRVGVDLDLYYERAPGQFVGNGIGSEGEHGANVFQLAGYQRLLFFFGTRDQGILSDETRSGSNDESDDLRRLLQWRAEPGLRAVAWFGDSYLSGLDAGSTQGAAAVTNDLSVLLQGSQLGPSLDGQDHVRVRSQSGALTEEWITDRASPTPASLDDFEATGDAVATHRYLDAAGEIYAGFAAVVLHDRTDLAGDRKVDLSVGSALERMATPQQPGISTLPARARLLRQIRAYFGDPPVGSSTATGPTERGALRVWPNPLRGTTTIRFSTDSTGRPVQLRVFDLRGRLIREAELGDRARGRWTWDARDAFGDRVARGVYLVELRGPQLRRVRPLTVR